MSAARLRSTTERTSTFVVISASSFAIAASRSGLGSGSCGNSRPRASRRAAHRLPVPTPARDQIELRRDVAALHRGDRDAVRLEMVGMVVAAGVGVRDHHVGPERLEQVEQALRADVDRDVAERIGMVLELPLLHPGVAVAEADRMRHAELAARDVELGEARGGDGVRIVSGFARLHMTGAVAHLAVRAGHDDGLRALVAVAGENAAGAGRLVVGVGVDGHERVRSRATAPASHQWSAAGFRVGTPVPVLTCCRRRRPPTGGARARGSRDRR